MVDVSRRSFVAGVGAALPFSAWIEGLSIHAAGTPRVRYEARTPEGQAMLALYATGVKAMMARPERDPRGWLFHWYLHWVKGSTIKAAEIARIYGTRTGAQAKLAEETWSSCIPHVPGSDVNLFLPWHRMYVYFFEQLVRSQCGDASFTMPYWNYSTSDPATHGVLPPEFRQPADPLFGPLYRVDRNPGVNEGVPIDHANAGELSLGVLTIPRYMTNGAESGFCPTLAAGLHANVHTLVGNDVGMGQVPWSANDPVFGLHHGDIDRIWASWNHNGGINPDGAWLDQRFVFVDHRGRRVIATVREVADTASLHYTYDRLEPPPVEFVPSTGPQITRQALPAPVHTATNVALGADPVRVTLMAPASQPSPLLLRERVARLPEGRRIYVVLRNLSAQTTPGVLFRVYLELPSTERADLETPHRVGTINFFEAAAHAGHGPHPLIFSFDVTRLLRDLLARGGLSDTPSVTIAPAGLPATRAQPVVGEISLVEQ